MIRARYVGHDSALSKLWPGARFGAAATARDRAGEQDPAEVRRVVADFFWRRRLIILANVAFALAVATGYVAGSPRSFEAASLITTGTRPSEASRSGPDIEDRLHLLKSTAMAERLVDRLDLQLAAEFNPMLPPDRSNLSYDFGSRSLVPAGLRAQLPPAWADALGGAPAGVGLTDEQQAARLRAHVVDAVKARIEVEPARPSVTRIAFRSADPDLSAAAANALAELYLDDQGTWEQQSQGLEREIERLSASIDATEKAIAALPATAAARADLAGEQDLFGLTTEREFWRTERAEIEARQRLEALGAEPSLDQAAPLLNSDRLGALQARAIDGTEALERRVEAERQLLQTYVDRLELRQLPGRADDLDARIVALASVPQTPQRPPLLLIYGVGLSGGLLLGILIALGVEASDRRGEA